MLARGTSVFNAHRSKDINVWWHVAHGGMGMDNEVHENQANENESTNPAEKVENKMPSIHDKDIDDKLINLLTSFSINVTSSTNTSNTGGTEKPQDSDEYRNAIDEYNDRKVYFDKKRGYLGNEKGGFYTESEFFKDGSLDKHYSDRITKELIEDMRSSEIEIIQNYVNVYKVDILDFLTHNLNTRKGGAVCNLFDNRLLLGYFVLKDDLEELGLKYDDCILSHHPEKFSFYQLYCYRYIRSNAPKSYSTLSIKEEVLSDIIDDIESEIDDTSKSYESFRNNEAERLKRMLNYTVKINLSKLNKSLSCLDLCFFNYILDTYDENNALHIRKNKLNRVQKYYYKILRNGFSTIYKTHKEAIDLFDYHTFVEIHKQTMKRMALLEINQERFHQMNEILEEANSLPPDSAIDVLKKCNKIMLKTINKLNDAIRYERQLIEDGNNKIEALIQEISNCQYGALSENSDAE